MNVFAERIQNLRTLMAGNGWDAVIITGSDPHASEYVAERWRQVAWLSGFTGEAGDLVITMDHAGLWTDSRFFIQASMQLEGTGGSTGLSAYRNGLQAGLLWWQWTDSVRQRHQCPVLKRPAAW